MTLDTWERLGPGRYATALNGHTLQIVKNPDWPTDNRRYVPVVDRVPLAEPCFNLSQAKTKAIKYALGLQTERVKAKNAAAAKALWKPDYIKPEPAPEADPKYEPELKQDPAERLAWPMDEGPDSSAPNDVLGLDYATFEEVPEAPPAMAQLMPPEEPAEEPAVRESTLSIALSGIAITGDSASTISAIRAAVDLLRGVEGAQDVKCRIYLPDPWIDV